MAAAVETPMDIDGHCVSRESKKDEKEKVAALAPRATSTTSDDVVYSPELLQMYYSRLFPFSMLHTWLSYGKKNPQIFSRREFSFTIEPAPGEEIYIRYQSFPGRSELSQAILKRRPCKIDIGAVFSHPPKDHNAVQSNKFKPVQRELVFDIDLTDYDDIRRCGCSGAKICGTCWTFMGMAVKVMDEGLRQDFGFEHIAWFYSGRRGVHAWVCDESARELTDHGRSAVASYFEVNLGTDKKKEVNLPHPLHPMLARAFAVLEPLFVRQVIPSSGHGLLADKEEWDGLLKSLPESVAPVRDNLTKKWEDSTSSPAEKWEELKKHLQIFVKGTSKSGAGKAAKNISTKERCRVENWPAEVVFRYTYPRLDINVSKQRNHLLKSPFCVHPKTGRVCVPIQADRIESFDPFDVPTLPQLMKELDDFDESDAGPNLLNWQKTTLKDYFLPFQKNFLEPLTKVIRRQERDAAEQQAALTGDF